MQGQIMLLVVRVAVGAMMFFVHGLPKLMDFQQKAHAFPDPFGLGGKVSLGMVVFAEVFCSLALILGLMTRLVSIPLAVTMGVAAFHIHAYDPFAKKELAIMYLLFYLLFIFNGGGRYALDDKIGRPSYFR